MVDVPSNQTKHVVVVIIAVEVVVVVVVVVVAVCKRKGIKIDK